MDQKMIRLFVAVGSRLRYHVFAPKRLRYRLFAPKTPALPPGLAFSRQTIRARTHLVLWLSLFDHYAPLDLHGPHKQAPCHLVDQELDAQLPGSDALVNHGYPARTARIHLRTDIQSHSRCATQMSVRRRQQMSVRRRQQMSVRRGRGAASRHPLSADLRLTQGNRQSHSQQWVHRC